MPVSEDKLFELGKALGEGKSVRQIARDFGLAKRTVQRYRKIYVEECDGDFDPCGCGRPSGHKGRCRYLRAIGLKVQVVR